MKNNTDNGGQKFSIGSKHGLAKFSKEKKTFSVEVNKQHYKASGIDDYSKNRHHSNKMVGGDSLPDYDNENHEDENVERKNH